MAAEFSFVAFCICSALVQTAGAGGYVETSWPLHAAQDTSHDRGNYRPQSRPVPTLSYDYEPPKPRQRHHSGDPWEGSRYSAPPKIQLPSLALKTNVVDALASHERRTKIPTTGVYRTYGRGRVVIPYTGAAVHVPMTHGSNKAYRTKVSTRLFDVPKHSDWDSNNVVSRSRRACAGCPKDEIVVASRGNAYVLLPEPCLHSWHHFSGPKPGSQLTEGVHHITGMMGNRRRVCQYQYEVKVRHCPPLDGLTVEVSCSADNAWGSKCSFTCPNNGRLEGESSSECGDDLQWTHREPNCVASSDCLIPNIENGTKLNCETNELSSITDSNYLPDGAYCRTKSNETETAIKCKKGEWKKVSHLRGKHRKNGKYRNHKKDWSKGMSGSNHCDPNPCLQGGSCLISTNGLHPSYICRCKPLTEGPRCEFSECQDNPCQNNARCLRVNGEPNCFCTQSFTGAFCERTQ